MAANCLTEPNVGDIKAKRSEILCFAQNKSKVLAFDDVVDICVDFYTWDEIAAARTILYEYLPSDKRVVPGPRFSAAHFLCYQP